MHNQGSNGGDNRAGVMKKKKLLLVNAFLAAGTGYKEVVIDAYDTNVFILSMGV